MFYSAIAGFVAGIFFRSFVELGAGFSWFLILIGAVMFILPFLKGVPPSAEGRDLNPPFPTFDLRKSKVGDTSFYKGGIIMAVFLIAAGLGIWRYDLADAKNTKTGLEQFINRSIALEGVIADEPDIRETNTRLILRFDKTSSKLLLVVNHEPRFVYGDRVTVSGKLQRPENFSDETTLREIDYRSHLAKDSIYYEMFRPKITLVAHGEGNPVAEKLFAFKSAFIGNLRTVIPEPHVSLLGGLIIGAKQSLGKKLLDDFRTVGVIHIVVLSGYNITIIARFIEWLFSGLRRNARLIIAAGAIMLFAIMVGASATVVRATIMALLVLLAHGTGRLYAVTRALLIAGVIMLLHNPKILVFDTSFELSFLATVGLIYLSPFIEPRVGWITKRLKLREIVVATIATQLFVLPFLLYKTGIFSVVSLPVNLLILAAIPLTMLFGFLAGILGFASMLLAFPFAYAAYALLAYELGVVEWFARLPFAAVTLPSFPLWLAVLWYALYAMLYILWCRKQSTSVSAPPVLP